MVEDNKQKALIEAPRSPSKYIGATSFILWILSSLIPIDFCVDICFILGMISLALGILDLIRKREPLDCVLGIGLGSITIFFWIYNLIMTSI